MSKVGELIQELCPDGVEQVALGEVAELKRGTSISKKNIQTGEVPVIAGGLTPAYYIDEPNREGEVIVVAGSGANAGFVSFWDEPVFVSDAFSIQSHNDHLLPKYVFHVLKSKQDQLHDLKKGGGVPHVYAKDVAVLLIPFPPLEVQEEIVRILDQFVELDRELEQEIAGREKQFQICRRELLLTLDTQTNWLSLGAAEDSGMVKLGRGKVISKKTIAENPGNYPVYSSSSTGDGEFGRYSEYMFEDERITWSVDGGGKIFYRPAHRYSVTNVSGWLSNLSDDLHTKFLYYGGCQEVCV